MSNKKQLPGKDELKAALGEYLSRNPGIESSYDEPTDSYFLADANGRQTIIGPGYHFANPNDDPGIAELEEKVREIIMAQRMGEDAPEAPRVDRTISTRKEKAGLEAMVPSRGITSRSQAGSVPGSALEAVRECQATEKGTYSTGKGRKVASAKTNIAALLQAGGSLDIVGREHTPTYIEIVGRASLGNQHVDSSRSFFKQEYLAKKAWEWIIKVLMKDPGIVIGTDDYGMPEFREDAEIQVRINDENENRVVTLPAKIALWREMAREWQAAGRVCETVAYSRACDMLLRSDFQSLEELAEEASEVRAIQDKEIPEAA